MIFKGVIEGFRGIWGSGIGFLVFADGSQVPCENAATVRALDSCFGDVIGPGHTVDNENGKHVGREVYYSTDAFGLLEGFTPVEEAPEPLVQAYEAQYTGPKRRRREQKQVDN